MIRHISLSVFFALLLTACGNGGDPGPVSDLARSAQDTPAQPAQPAQPRVPEENPALGFVRWGAHEQRFTRLTCSPDGDDFTMRAHAEAFRFRIGFRGEDGGGFEQIDFSQSRDVEMILGDGPRFDRDSYIALGEHGEVILAAADPHGARGTALLLPGTGDARENHPEGLEIEFAINCP